MAEIGIFLSSEEHGPNELVDHAALAEQAGFRSVWISDHYHPWVEAQGSSPFVWGVIGAIARTTSLKVTTAVTCPTVRIHPAVLAQAAATSAILLKGRFVFGVGSGENLNEHILGDGWPETDVRLEMLEEAVEVIRKLWDGGFVSHRGTHYTVQNARIYDLPDTPPPVYVSGFGPKATELAGRIGDGYINTSPSQELVELFEQSGGKGKPKQAGVKVCWGEDEEKCRRLAHETWPTSGISGELSQELPMPAHFEQAASSVTEDDIAEKLACGPDPERHVEAIRPYLEAGYDEIYVAQIGDDQQGMLDFYQREVLPRL
jgi:G6PDH family F420-dependent oxidoreductase